MEYIKKDPDFGNNNSPQESDCKPVYNEDLFIKTCAYVCIKVFRFSYSSLSSSNSNKNSSAEISSSKVFSELDKIQYFNLSLSKSNIIPSVSKGNEKALNLSLSL